MAKNNNERISEEQKTFSFDDDFSEDDKIRTSFHKFENENDFIVGIYKRKEQGQYGYNIVLETEQGEVTVAGYTALNSRINDEMINHKIKIIYLGEKKALKGGRTYKDFEIFCKK